MSQGGGWWSWFGLLAGKLKERAWLRWILQNWDVLVVSYIWLVGFAFLWVVFGSIFFDPNSFTAKGLTFRSGAWVGFLMALGWAAFQAAGIPIALLTLALSPVLLLVFVIGGALWLLGLFVGSVALVGFGPFVVLFGGRALLIRMLASWFREADQREAEERGVMAALGLGDAPERSLDGKARLMGPEEVAKFNAKPISGAGTRVGTIGGKAFHNFTEKHVLIVAGTRGGKGRDLIIPNLWAYSGSVFVLDPKGENAQRTHEKRREFGPVLVLDPFGVSGLPSARFNPLRYLAGPSMVTDAQTFADALIQGENDHWTSSARGLLTGLILHVATAPGLPLRDLPTVRRLLMRNLTQTLEDMTKNTDAPDVVVDVGEWGLNAAPEEWASIVSNAIEQTKWLASPQIAAVLQDGGQQIDFNRYKDSVMSVFVCLPAPYFRTFSQWLRLVVAAALDTLTQQLNPDMPQPTRFVLDEVAQLGNLEKIESALTLSAGYGVQLWGVWQHLKDIERCYPRSGVGGWVSSSGLRLVFSVQDNETLRYFAKATGDALTETDIRHLPPGKLLCMMDGENPILVDRWPGPAGYR